MKKSILGLLVAFLFSFQTVMAQEGLHLSIKGTPHFSFITGDVSLTNGALDLGKRATLRGNFGVGAEYNFTENIGLGLDVMYSIQGQRYKLKTPLNIGIINNLINGSQDLSYIKLPLYVTFVSDPSAPVSFYGKVGPQISFLTSSDIEVTGISASGLASNLYRKTLIGAMVNSGLQFRLSESLSLQTGVYFDVDFNKTHASNILGNNLTLTNSRNMNVGLQVGLKFAL